MKEKAILMPIILNNGQHCIADTVKQVHVNQPVQLNSYSGQIIPRTKDAVQAIKRSTSFAGINVANGSILELSDNVLPKDIQVKKHSHVIIDPNVHCDGLVVTHNSQIHLASGSNVTNSTFEQSRTGEFVNNDDQETFLPQAAQLNVHDSTFYNTNLNDIMAFKTSLFDCTATRSSFVNTDITHVNLHTLNKVIDNPKYSNNDYNFIDHSVFTNTRFASEAAIIIHDSTISNSTFMSKRMPFNIGDSRIDKCYFLNDMALERSKLGHLSSPYLIWDSKVDHLISNNVVDLLSAKVSAPAMKPIVANKLLSLIDTDLRFDKAVCLTSKLNDLNTYDAKDLKANYTYNQLISYNENKHVKDHLFADGLDKIHDEPFNDYAKINTNVSLINEVASHTKTLAQTHDIEPEL